MNLIQSLTAKKAAILRKWADAVFDTYPGDTAAFLRSEKDRFANPVGYATTISLDKILDGLLTGSDIHALSAYIEDIIKIRAVQDFSPPQAASFPLLQYKRQNHTHARRLKDLRERDSQMSRINSLVRKMCSNRC